MLEDFSCRYRGIPNDKERGSTEAPEDTRDEAEEDGVDDEEEYESLCPLVLHMVRFETDSGIRVGREEVIEGAVAWEGPELGREGERDSEVLCGVSIDVVPWLVITPPKRSTCLQISSVICIWCICLCCKTLSSSKSTARVGGT